MHVVRREAGALEHRGGFHLAVNAPARAESPPPGARRARCKGAARSSCGSKPSATVRSRILLRRQRRILLVRALRIIAQASHAPGGLGPGALSSAQGSSSCSAPTRICTRSSPPARRGTARPRRAHGASGSRLKAGSSAARICIHHARLLGEQLRQRRARAPPAARCRRPQCRRMPSRRASANRPPSSGRGTRAACPRRACFLEPRRVATQLRGVVRSGRFGAELAVHLRQRRGAQAVAWRAEIDRATARSGAHPSCSAGVQRCGARRFDGRERRDDQRHRRDHAPVDRASLQRGAASTANPCRPGSRCRARAQLLAHGAAPCRRAPHPRRARRTAAIQLAERRMSPTASRYRRARMLVIASATARRPEAGASSTATGVRSPIAIASPAWPSIIGERDGDIAHRHLPGPDHLDRG